MDITILKRH